MITNPLFFFANHACFPSKMAFFKELLLRKVWTMKIGVFRPENSIFMINFTPECFCSYIHNSYLKMSNLGSEVRGEGRVIKFDLSLIWTIAKWSFFLDSRKITNALYRAICNFTRRITRSRKNLVKTINEKRIGLFWGQWYWIWYYFKPIFFSHNLGMRVI